MLKLPLQHFAIHKTAYDFGYTTSHLLKYFVLEASRLHILLRKLWRVASVFADSNSTDFLLCFLNRNSVFFTIFYRLEIVSWVCCLEVSTWVFYSQKPFIDVKNLYCLPNSTLIVKLLITVFFRLTVTKCISLYKKCTFLFSFSFLFLFIRNAFSIR